jgi:hypothetical protein
MEMVPGFLEEALKAFALDPSLAGVAGLIEDLGELNVEFRMRQTMPSGHRQSGQVPYLGCGGLYRVSAVQSVGYLSNRNLHAFEELELGIRLACAGWKMIRLPCFSIKHHVHQTGGYTLLLRRLKSGYLMGSGEILRSSLGKPYFRKVIPRFRYLYVTGLWLFTICIFMLLPFKLGVRLLGSFVLFFFPFLVMTARYKDIGIGVFCIIQWVVSLLGALQGFLRSQVDPRSPVDSITIRKADSSSCGSRTLI